MFNLFKKNKEDYLKLLEENLFIYELKSKKISKKNINFLKKAFQEYGNDIMELIIKKYQNQMSKEKILLTIYSVPELKEYIYNYIINEGLINEFVLKYPSLFFQYIEQESKNWVFLKYLIENNIFYSFKNKEEFHRFFLIIKNNKSDFLYISKNEFLFKLYQFIIESYIKNIEHKKDYYEYLLLLTVNIEQEIKTNEFFNLMRILNILQSDNLNEIIYSLNKIIENNKNIIIENKEKILSKEYIRRNNFYYYFFLYFILKLEIKEISKIFKLIQQEYMKLTKPFIKEYEPLLEDINLELAIIIKLLKEKESTYNFYIIKQFISAILKLEKENIELLNKIFNQNIVNIILELIDVNKVYINKVCNELKIDKVFKNKILKLKKL